VSDSVITVDQVSKRFKLYSERNQSLKATVVRGKRSTYKEFWALKDVSFEIPEGSTFGLIGENGSGKSTLLKCIAKILTPDSGKVTTRGRLAALLELGSGFHQELSGRDNIYLNGSILGLTRKELDRQLDSIIAFSGIEEFIDQPVKNYSSGMYVRLGFSIAIHVEPDILLVDEILAVGDTAFQRRCMEKFAEFRSSGRTVVLVSHAMGTLRDMCDNAAWLQHGELVGVGSASTIVDDYIIETAEDRIESTSEIQQSGSGQVLITDVELLDSRGSSSTLFRTGETQRIRLHYNCTKPVHTPVFGLAVQTLDGVRLWAHHTRDAGINIPVLDGEGYIDVVVDKLMLQAGTFDVSVSVTDWARQHIYHVMHDVKRFDVQPGSIRESDGLVAQNARWDPLHVGA